MAHAVPAMEDQGPGVAVAAGVAVVATSAAAASHRAVAETLLSIPPGTAAPALAPKPSAHCCYVVLWVCDSLPLFLVKLLSCFYIPSLLPFLTISFTHNPPMSSL